MMCKRIEKSVKAGRGRPRQLDREVALNRTLDVFWQQGAVIFGVHALL